MGDYSAEHVKVPSFLLRENVRFAMYGEGGCPVNPHNEPFSTKRLSDHVGELTRLAGAACSRHAVRLVALIAYTRPFRSVLALIAWCTSVASPARIPGWFMLFAFLDLMDALGGARLPRDTSLDEKDAAVFAAGLRALAPAEATRESIAGKKKDFLRVKVPTKPLGFLAASTVERDPARPEAHRSAVAAAAPLVPKDKAV